MQTEKEDQVGVNGQNRDAQQHALESNYFDDGPSIMPASESFAGNQENWGASATEHWGTSTTGTGAVETNEWNPTTAVNTATSGW